MTDLYGVMILRRHQGGQIQLNFSSKEAASNVFAGLQELKERKIFQDSFGTKLSVDPEDVAHVLFIDVEQNLKFQSVSALAQARAQANVTEQAKRDPALTRGAAMILPGPGGRQ